MPALFTSGYCVKTPSWHKQENLLGEAPKTVRESLRLAGQDWEVALEELKDIHGNSLNDIGRLIRRMDNNQPLAIVGPKTHVLQNHQAFSVFQQFMDSGDVTLETAGALDEGRKVWTLARLNRPNVEVVKGDEVAKYLLVSNSHDGTLAVRIGFTPVRVVCWNTLSAAIFSKEAQKSMIKIRHSQQVVQRVENAAAVIGAIDKEYEKASEVFKAIARKGINGSQTKEYFKKVFDMKEDGNMSKQSETLLTRLLELDDENRSVVNELLAKDTQRKEIDNVAQEIIGKQLLENLTEKMETGIGTDNLPSRGTWWTAYNAVTQYLTHESGRTDQTRLASLWYGASAKLNDEAIKLAVEMSGVA